MGIFSTLFDENERNVRKLKKIADKVEELSERFKAMSDEELQAITPVKATEEEKLSVQIIDNDYFISFYYIRTFLKIPYSITIYLVLKK